MKKFYQIWGCLIFALCSFVVLQPASAQNDVPCAFSTSLEVARLYRVPFPDDFYAIGILTPGQPYPMLRYSGQFFEVQTPDGQTAWVDQRAGGVSAGCNGQLMNLDLPLTAFEGVCFVTIAGATPVYSDANLTQTSPAAAQLMVGAYHVVRESERAYLVAVSSAMGMWFDKSAAVGFTAACNALPIVVDAPQPVATTAIAAENTRVWTRPDVNAGIVIGEIPPATTVTVTSGPVRGTIRYDMDITGDWYRVQTPTVSGWVWGGRLEFVR